MLYFEDLESGQVLEFGGHTVTEDEILDFARRYDPQPFHVDLDAAAAGPFGGLVASGWHTAALFMRMYVDAILLGAASMGSPGVEELRWTKPVRPGDTLRGRARVLETRASSTNPERGTIRSKLECLNQEGEVVMTMLARGFIRRRP
ncbi:MAG TPA: MaoC family dehydratase [Gaiellaceae bacterium]|jgi:acyl dehydratase|nr:MaoC family dehydratase [Gaiellaceae bacterium]